MERAQELKRPIDVPYVSTMRREINDKIPGHERAVALIFNEINKQAIDNFGIFQSEEFPGVSFSTIHLSITPEFVRKLAIKPKATPEEEKPQVTKDQIWFVQPALGVYMPKIGIDNGHVFSALDMGIDRFIREIPKVARAIKHGEIPPKVDIFVVGSPISMGGSVTKAWRDEVNRIGFNAHGRLYAEYVAANVPSKLDNTRIVVTGPSRGSVTSERTYHYLPDEIKKHAQGLHDIPAGNHDRNLLLEAIKGPNMGIGMAAEMAVRVAGDRTSKDLGKTENAFNKVLREVKGVPEDNDEQRSLKGASFLGEMKALWIGTPPDYGERSFYRSPVFDPTNIKGHGILETTLGGFRRFDGMSGELHWRRYFMSQRGRKLIAFTSRKAHSFPWKKSFERWEQVLTYCETP